MRNETSKVAAPISNATRAPYERLPLHRLFERQARATPEETAVIFGEARLSFRELDARSEKLARHLRRLGVAPDERVGVFVHRSLDMVVGLLGVLKAGGAYVPLDPMHPAERLRLMLEDARVKAILTEDRLRARLPDVGATLVCLDTAGKSFEPPLGPEHATDTEVTPENLAYVIFTSGSTGRPKGVAVEHGSVAALLGWGEKYVRLDERRGLLAATTIGFDISVFEIFLPLCFGGTVVLATNALELPKLPAADEVTMINTVPSVMDQILSLGPLPPNVRTVLFVGEPLRRGLVERVYASANVERIINCYGPTETTVYSTCSEVARDGHEDPTIGRPIANEQAFVLDEDLRPVPPGEIGELYLGGAGLARGYFERPELTAERFLPNPLTGNPELTTYSDRLYRTGDLARHRADGQLEFLGRVDHQVKLNGHRIELQEIEIALSRLEHVREAVVMLREEAPAPSLPREPRLVAYLTPRENVVLPRAEWELHRLPNDVPVQVVSPEEADHLYDLLFNRRVYLREGIRLRDGDCIFDVGANIGLFTIFAHLECKSPRVFAFEPVPSIFRALQANIAICDLDVTAFPYGLSDAAKTIEFTFYPRWSALSGAYADRDAEERLSRAFLRNQSALLTDYADEIVADRFEGESVPCELKTLSDAIRENGIDRIDLLKVNVEKSELDVLRGIAPEDWPKVRQSVIEVHDGEGHLEATVDLLRRQGFSVKADQIPEMLDTSLFMVYAWREDDPHADAAMPPPPHGPVELHLPGLRREVLSVEKLRRDLGRELPDAMVPRVYVRLDEMPLNLAGKTDRKALPPPDTARAGYRVDAPYAAPQDELQQSVCEVWQEVLEVPRVGLDDRWSDLGGRSLQAVLVHRRLTDRLSRTFPLTELVRFPTVRLLSDYLNTCGADAGPATKNRPSVELGQRRAAARRSRMSGREAVRRGRGDA